MQGIRFSLFLLFCFNLFLVYHLIEWWRSVIFEFSAFEERLSTWFDGNNVFGTLSISVPVKAHVYNIHFLNSARQAMVLFIASEVMFFFSFFWAFFHSLGSPAVEVGGIWPPFGLDGVLPSPLLIPLGNTLLLLTSGVTVTWAHQTILTFTSNESRVPDAPSLDKLNDFAISLSLTVLLALNFILWQAFEFVENFLQMSDGIYGSCFYILTGFHGFHVIVGTIFLSVFLYQAFVELVEVNKQNDEEG